MKRLSVTSGLYIFHADQKKKKKKKHGEFSLRDKIESNSLVTRCLNFMIDVKKYRR